MSRLLLIFFLTSLNLFGRPQNCIAVPDDLISWWRGEVGATDDFDSNNGTIFGGVTVSSGEVGSSLNFNGVDGYVLIPASSNLNVQSFTIEGWIYPQDVTAGRPIFEFSQPGVPTGVHIWLGTAGFSTSVPGAIYVNLRDENLGNHLIYTAAGALTQNAWNYIAITYDQGNGIANIFVNGSVAVTQVFERFRPRTNLPLYLGWRPTGIPEYFGAAPFPGKMDEISLYGRALKPSEVSAIFDANSKGKCLSPTIVSTTLPAAELGSEYFFTIATKLGTLPYSFSVISGSVPDGLRLSTNGTIQGVPTTSGTATFTVQVTDRLGGTGTKTLSILTPGCTPLPDSIVSWWPGNGTGHDVIGTNDIILHVGDYGPGKVRSGFLLDGFSSYGVAMASPTLNVSTFSMEAWINPTDVSAPRAILEYAIPGGLSGAHFWLGLSGNGFPTPGALFANLRDSQLRDHVISTAPGIIPENQWTHAVLTYDQPTGRTTIYVNGIAVVTEMLGIFQPQTALPLYMGIRPPSSRDYTGASPFAGTLDELTLYSRALEPSEVAGLYSAGPQGKCLNTPFIPILNGFTAAYGASFSTQIPVELGTAPYAFTLAEGSLPNGLGLGTNGVLSGIPTEFGEFELTVRVVDSLNASSVRNLLIRVPEFAAADSSLVSWWPANGSAKDIADTNNLTLTNVSFAPGKVGTAFQFNGADAFGVVQPGPSLNVTSFSLDLWMNPADVNVRRPVIEYSSPTGPLGVSIWLGVSSNNVVTPGALYVNFRDTLGGDHIMSTGTGALRPNDWNYVAISYDRPSGVAVLFVNGTSMVRTLGFFTPNTSLPLYFGTRPQGNQFYNASPPFAGKMDEVSLYGRALSVSELMAIYQADVAGKSPMSLWARESGSSISLSWLSLATNVLVETTSDLSTVPWTLLPATPSLFKSGLRLRVVQPNTNSAQFFRLRGNQKVED
jgi:hypothetical protein